MSFLLLLLSFYYTAQSTLNESNKYDFVERRGQYSAAILMNHRDNKPCCKLTLTIVSSRYEDFYEFIFHRCGRATYWLKEIYVLIYCYFSPCGITTEGLGFHEKT